MQKKQQKQEDARIIKTRAKLFDSFTALLAEKQFEEITINEICDRAKVRRATFYKHFRDKYDFLRVLTASLLLNFEAEISECETNKASADYHIAFVRKLIHFILDNEDAVNLIIKSNMQSTLIDIIIKEIYKFSFDWLSYAEKCGTKLITNAETVATMLSGGIATIVIKWFNGEKKISPSELCSDISVLVRAMFVE